LDVEFLVDPFAELQTDSGWNLSDLHLSAAKWSPENNSISQYIADILAANAEINHSK